MLFSSQTFVRATAVLSAISFASAREDTHLCEGNGPFQLTKMYGKSQNDIAFCDTKWDKGLSVTGMQMWATKNHVKAYQLTYSDGTKSPIRGDNTATEGNSGNWYGTDTKSWKEGDLITDVHLAANYWGNGDGLGGMTMAVAGQHFEVKSDIGSFAGEPQNIGSGLLIGAYGSAGGFVNSFGLVFLKQAVTKSQIVDMKFPMTIEEMNKQQTGVETVTLKTASFKNSSPLGSGNMSYTFASSAARTTSRTFTESNKHTFGFEVGVEVGGKVGVPFVAEGEIKVSTKVSYGYENIKSTADMTQNADTTTFTQGGSLAPGRGAVCKATSLSGSYSTDYTNVIQITTADGQSFTINRPAHFNSVGYTQAVVDCKEMALKDLPDAGRSAEEIGGQKPRSGVRSIEFHA